MIKTIYISCFILFIVGLITMTGCAGIEKGSGHHKTRQQISKDSADKIKANIRQVSNDDFKPYHYTGTNKITINYRLLSPIKTNEKDKYPLVLILHGSGAIGTDNISQLGVLAKLWAQPTFRNKYPAYIVVPQFPQRSSNYTLNPNKKVLVSEPDICLTTALQLIDSLKKALLVNERKIYVVGFSMGASSAINAVDLRPNLFAAAISISGIPEFNHINTLAQIPVWLIHGNADSENPINSDYLLYKELRDLNTRHLTFWEVDGLEHDIYSGLYTGDAIPKWLFRHKANNAF